MSLEKMVSTAVSLNTCPSHDDQYEEFLSLIRSTFNDNTKDIPALFVTDAGNSTIAGSLFDIFLHGLPNEHRQHYTCNACRHFVNNFGGLVRINEDGSIKSVMWDADKTPELFEKSVKNMQDAVKQASVVGVHLTKDAEWGKTYTTTPVGHKWFHFAVNPNPSILCKGTALMSPSQIAADKHQDMLILKRGLAEFPIDAVKQACVLLQSDALYRSEKVLGVATWLLALQEKLENVKNSKTKNNLIWAAVAKAPTGFCHIRSTMIGTLLEDIVSGMPFDRVSKRFADKMHPLQYQRPTAQPSDGQIIQAEKTIAALGAAGAFDRRFAKLEDLKLVWKPVEPKESKGEGVFGYLKASAKTKSNNLSVPRASITWTKFVNTVLPTAENIEYFVPRHADNYCAFVTAANNDTPPVLQWDFEDERNPVSWYVYSSGSAGRNWNLPEGDWVKVTGISPQPSTWSEKRKFEHQGDGVVFVLDGAYDTHYRAGAGMFPEILKSDYHGIRHTLEAHVKRTVVAGAKEATACGILIKKPGGAFSSDSNVFRVTSKGVTMEYKIDRWD